MIKISSAVSQDIWLESKLLTAHQLEVDTKHNYKETLHYPVVNVY